MSSTTLADARTQFRGGRGYLAACTLGLPTRATLDAMRADTELWADGRASAARYTDVVERTRGHFAALVGVGPESVAVAAQTSVFVAAIAASAPDGADVLCVDGDFSSVVFPFLSQAHRGVRVRHVSVQDLASSITANTWLVAFSLVQSATGEVADVAAITAAAAAHGCRTLCDTTQAVGWMPVDASDFDASVCHSYKWLCAPRGAAFLTLSAAFADEIRPVQTGWYAGQDPWTNCYGPAMALAEDVSRFDVSPAWPAWVGAEPALDLFRSLDMNEVNHHVTGLAASFCDGLGLESPRHQAIVAWPDPEGSDLARLTAAGIAASGRAGRARVAFHLWSDERDVADALRALGR